MKIVVFSGAGMSAESGINTFRDANGLWANHKIEDVATPQAWLKDPEKVQHFYNQRRKQILESSPNEAHFLIKEMEKLGKVTVITQNIDDLHERAGSIDVVHLHGNIRESKSSGPNQETHYYPIEGWELKMGKKCVDGYQLRPHVVWFGESVPNLEVAADIISKASVLIVIGTSLQVYPAAGLIHAAPLSCTKFLIDPNALNLQVPSDFIVLNETASEGMLQCLGLLKEKSGPQ
jgi:NAD-dependent deacetylase